MLFHLFNNLQSIYSWLNVFRYQTFRAMLAFLLSFLAVLLLQPIFIRKLRSLGVAGQPIREDGPTGHLSKKGTPTMGGAVLIFAVILSLLLLVDLTNLYVWLSLVILASFAVLGFVDDWRKIVQQNTKGVTARQKLAWQFGLAAMVAVVLMLAGFSTDLTLPFLKDIAVPLGLLFIPFVALVVVGSSNAVNLTDGLDGLAIGPVMTVSAAYMVFSYVAGNSKLSQYLAIPYVAGVGELSIVLAAVIGAGLGFLWYNTFPAQIFMGDVGALALGSLLGMIAVLTKQEMVLIVAGGVFVLEAVSVILQVYSYKLTGKRLFRMAPLHHHYELKGWPEPKIIVRFWIISIVLALVSLTTLKLR